MKTQRAEIRGRRSEVGSQRSGARSHESGRRGMAVVLVLGLLALTLTLSYAMLRLEYQVEQSQTNISGQDRARLAAVAGISVALRRMHDGTWGGVDTTLSGNLGTGVSYSVNFTTGDPALTSSHADYGEYPYRVSVSSVGFAVDPAQPNAQVSYRVNAVAQLARRQMNTAATPSRWTVMNNYTVYQWNASPSPRDATIELPCTIRGNACFEGAVKLAQAYPKYSNSRERYLKDLKLLSQAGTEYRPFTGTVTFDSSRQSGSITTDLNWLGVTTNLITAQINTPLVFPTAVSTYQLYPGGKVYSIPRLQDAFGVPAKNQVIAPDTQTNPLGIYRTDGSWTFQSGSRFTGTLLSDSSTAIVTAGGTNIQWNGLNLPLLEGSTSAYQLPLVMAKNDVAVAGSSLSAVNGLVVAWNQFTVNPGAKTTQLTLTGRVFSDGFAIHKRTEWDALTQTQWQQSLADFEAQYNPLLFLLGSEQYYPRWMERSPYLLAAAPKLTLSPPTNVSYHWPDFSQPIYTKANGDLGLRWNLVSWGEATQ